MLGHNLMGVSLLLGGDIIEGRTHLEPSDCRITIPPEIAHLHCAFGQDTRVTALIFRALARWILGYPESGPFRRCLIR